MSLLLPNMLLALPEIVMLIMACVLLLLVALLGDKGVHKIYLLSQLTLIGTALLLYLSLHEQGGIAFHGHYIKDPLSTVLKLAVCVINSVVLLYSTRYLAARDLWKGEYYVLAICATLGMMIMISGGHFLSLYLGLELMSLCLYALVAMQRDSTLATEAAMKYFILGAIASGMLLYGISMVYGATGSLELATIAATIAAGHADISVLNFALVFLVIGIAFKLGAVPFHMWLPDVYHGAPTAVTLLIATTLKIAAFALAIRILGEGLASLHSDWQTMLILLAVLSMIIGNMVAIAQTNIKRMLAYSTISHIGFILLGLLAGSEQGYAAALFYALVYSMMTLASFGIILLLSRQGFEADHIDDYKGLSQRHPWYALMMLITLFSLAGIPPLIGFYGKLTVLKAIIESNLMGVAIIAVIMSVIGAFYYLRIIKLMYFDKPLNHTPLQAPLDMRLIISINGLVILGLGLFPGALLTLCYQVFIS